MLLFLFLYLFINRQSVVGNRLSVAVTCFCYSFSVNHQCPIAVIRFDSSSNWHFQLSTNAMVAPSRRRHCREHSTASLWTDAKYLCRCAIIYSYDLCSCKCNHLLHRSVLNYHSYAKSIVRCLCVRCAVRLLNIGIMICIFTVVILIFNCSIGRIRERGGDNLTVIAVTYPNYIRNLCNWLNSFMSFSQFGYWC